MGYLETANSMVDNSTKLMNQVLNSKFTSHLQGNGTPTTVTYYSVDNVTSTTTLGINSIDQIVGKNSPIRFNKIENFPVYGLKDLNPSLDEVQDGLMDLSMDIDITILPNTIKPNAFDHIVYVFGNRVIIFRVNGFELSTIKSNDYYKVTIQLKEIDKPSYIEKLNRQVIKTYKARLDTIGTEERCIIESNMSKNIDRLQRIINAVTNQYVYLFYNRRFNSVLYRRVDEYGIDLGNSAYVYDPYLTKFIIDHNLFNTRENDIQLVNFDKRDDVIINYNKSIFHNLDMRSVTMAKLHQLIKLPVTFKTTATNPFSYFGISPAFTLDLEDYDGLPVDDKLFYTGLLTEYIENRTILGHRDKSDATPTGCITNLDTIPDNAMFDGYNEILQNRDVYWNLIINFLTLDDLYDLLGQSYITLERLETLSIDYSYESFLYVPMLLYILKEYCKYLYNESQIA